MITQYHIKKILNYNKKTGIFLWRKSMGGYAQKNTIAGSIDSHGYRQIKVDGKLYLASRLAFLYVDGYWPENYVDHINRIRDDNSWKNLRHVSAQCNVRNSSVYKSNTSSITGVSWNKKNKKWKAHIGVNKKIIHIGYFKNKIDAAYARFEMEKKFNFQQCNSKTSAYMFLKKHGIKLQQTIRD